MAKDAFSDLRSLSPTCQAAAPRPGSCRNASFVECFPYICPEPALVKRCILTTKWHHVRKKDMGVSLPPLLRGGALLGLDGRDCRVVYHTQCAEGGEDEDPREVCDEEQVACETRNPLFCSACFPPDVFCPEPVLVKRRDHFQ